MYIPKVNEEKDVAVLREFMRENSFCALVTQSSAGMVATHIPMMIADDGSELGVLRGHISRANTQWMHIDTSVDALAIFSGPEHYISPSWYVSKKEHGKVVPTWNYVAVHAYGPLRVIQDPEWMLAHLVALTDKNEAALPVPWSVSDVPKDFIETMMKGIVGFEMPIRKLEGKWKMSQNRNEADVASVLHGLEEVGTPESLTMRSLVETRCRRGE